MVRINKLRGVDGSEIVETAFVLPVLFMLLLGIVWFARAFQTYSAITQAAEKGAMTAGRPVCASCGGGGWNSTSFPDNATVETAVFDVMDAARIDRAQTIFYIPGALQYCVPPVPAGGCDTTTSNISICRSVVLNPGGSVPQCGTIVSFQYQFRLNLPFTSLDLQNINLKAQAQSRMEN